MTEDQTKESFWNKTKKVLVKVAKNMKEAQEKSNQIASKDEIKSLASGISRMNDNLIGTAKMNYDDSMTGTSGLKFPDFDKMSGVTSVPRVPDTKVKVKTPKFVSDNKVEFAYDAVEQKQIKVKRGKDGRYDVIDDQTNPAPKVRTDFLIGDNNLLTGSVTKKRRK